MFTDFMGQELKPGIAKMARPCSVMSRSLAGALRGWAGII